MKAETLNKRRGASDQRVLFYAVVSGGDDCVTLGGVEVPSSMVTGKKEERKAEMLLTLG